MARRPTPLHWPDLRQPAGPVAEQDALLAALAAQGQAWVATVVRLAVLQDERITALEQRQQRAAVEAEYMTPKAAALRFGFSADTVSRWGRTGRVRSVGAGNSRRIHVGDLETLARYRAGSK